MKYGMTLAALLTLAVGTAAQANPRYGMAGCGLGSMIITENGFTQTFAATTNGSSATQTFGITTGSSNCNKDGVILASKEQEAFFEANYAQLRRDVASGGGEHLAALTVMFECDASLQPDVGALVQSQYEAIFPNGKTTPIQALYLLKLQLARNSKVANACAAL